MRRIASVLACAALAVCAASLAQEQAAPPLLPPKEDDAARVARISRELEALRGKKFKHEVKLAHQSAEEFRRFVEAQLDKELPPAEAEAQSKALQAFGLLPRGYDLRKGIADLFVSQGGAYYNPETKTFYLLVVEFPQAALDNLILHELAHALQDQYYDLAPALVRINAAKDDDAALAFGHLVEGEATYITLRKELKAIGMDVDANTGMADLAFGQIRSIPREQIVAMTKQVADSLGPDGAALKIATKGLEGVPDYLFWQLYAPYFKGQLAVHRAFVAGGWKAVDGLFERPPASTEQVLHPEKAFGPGRDDPVPMAPGDDVAARGLALLGEGWRPVRTNKLGELGARLLLEEFLPPETAAQQAEKAAAGWGGDVYAVFEDPQGGLALMWFTTWDTVEDASEFSDALRAMKRPALGKAGDFTKGHASIFVDLPADAYDRFAVSTAGAAQGGGTAPR